MRIKTVPAKINGLFPGNGTLENNDPGSTVLVFIGENPNMVKLLLKKADSKGEVNGEIPIKYIGSKVTIRIRKSSASPFFKPFEGEIEVKAYGIFFTTRLIWDEEPNLLIWDSDKNYVDSKSILDDKIRNFRHKNNIARGIYYISIVVLIVLGVVVNPIAGLVIGLVGTVLGEFFSPYAIGLKKLF